jgi:hypothetical protein
MKHNRSQSGRSARVALRCEALAAIIMLLPRSWVLAPCGFAEGLHKPSTSLSCHFSPWRWTHVSPKRRHRPANPHSSRTQDFNNNNNSRLVRLPHLCPWAYILIPIIFHEQYKLFSSLSSLLHFAPHRSSYSPNHLVSDTLFPFLNVRPSCTTIGCLSSSHLICWTNI